MKTLFAITIATVSFWVSSTNAWSPNWGEEWDVYHLEKAQSFVEDFEEHFDSILVDGEGNVISGDGMYYHTQGGLRLASSQPLPKGVIQPVGHVPSNDPDIQNRQKVYEVEKDVFYGVYVYGDGDSTIASVERTGDGPLDFKFTSQGSLETFFNNYSDIAQRAHNHGKGETVSHNWEWVEPQPIPQWIKDLYPQFLHLFPEEVPGKMEHRHGTYGTRHYHKIPVSSYRHTADK